MNTFRLLILAACTTPAAFAGANLLVNGGFEVTSPFGFDLYGPQDSYDEEGGHNVLPTEVSGIITGWQASVAERGGTNAFTAFTVFAAPGLDAPNPADGGQLLNIGGFNTAKSVGLLWQDFATVDGQDYDVSFYFGRSNNSDDTHEVSVNASVVGVVDGEALGFGIGISSGNAPATGATGDLTLVSFQFTAGSDITRLIFSDTTDRFSVASLHLDAVSVTAVSAIPEPSSFAALAGVAALGLAALRRRRAA